MARAQAELKQQPPSFTEWLRGVCSEGGITTPSQLYRVFIEEASKWGVYRDKATITRWWNGGDPQQVADTKVLLKALARAVPDVDVYESFDRFMRFKPAPRGAGATVLRLRPS